MKKNPYPDDRIMKFAGGVEIKIDEDDYQYFQKRIDIYNNFEAVADNENMDLSSPAIIERLNNASNLFAEKQISLKNGIEFIKDPKTLNTNPSNNGGGGIKPAAPAPKK
jgi:hypothetical protein